MHQDQRIGLALGVLLIGACAAFFFRNETREIASTPRLQHAQELDDRIAERSTRPYLKGIEVVEAADLARARTISNRNEEAESSEDHVGSFWSPVESFAGKKPPKNSAGQGGPVASLLDADVEELEPIPVPVRGGIGHEMVNTSEPLAGRVEVAPEHRGTTSDSRLHLVQKGETLSSIAAKTLGSAHRFHELFAANQDQLKNPNDVRVGMTLQIPNPHEVTSLQTAAISPAPQTEVPTASRKFVPARRFTHLAKPFQSSDGPE